MPMAHRLSVLPVYRPDFFFFASSVPPPPFFHVPADYNPRINFVSLFMARIRIRQLFPYDLFLY